MAFTVAVLALESSTLKVEGSILSFIAARDAIADGAMDVPEGTATDSANFCGSPDAMPVSIRRASEALNCGTS